MVYSPMVQSYSAATIQTLNNSTCKTAFDWYLLSFKTKLPAFQLPWSAAVHGLPLSNGKDILQALADRFTELLRTIDEIGFQHYLGADNDTAQATAYHFNSFVTLVTGIFDSLAHLSVAYYDLKVCGGPSKLSLRKRAGKDFLKALKEANSDLFALIASSKTFIELFYPLREAILHRHRLEHAAFEYRGSDGQWKANVIEIPADVRRKIGQFDQQDASEGLSDWGLYHTFLEPFHFVKAATQKLIEFCNEYLERLNFDQRLEMYPEVKQKIEENGKSQTHRIFIKQVELFENNRLGF